MRRRVGIVLMAASLVVAFGATVPAGAAPAPTGDQINVLAGAPTTYDADTPFHVLHGWALDPAEARPVGKFGFELTLDGEVLGRGSPSTEIDRDAEEGEYLIKRWLYNFPDGLSAGEHEFVGTWYAPCAWAVADGWYDGPCPKKNAKVPAFTNTLVVTFG